MENRWDVTGPDDEEIVVVLTRWSRTREHRPAFAVDENTLLEMQGAFGG